MGANSSVAKTTSETIMKTSLEQAASCSAKCDNRMEDVKIKAGKCCPVRIGQSATAEAICGISGAIDTLVSMTDSMSQKQKSSLSLSANASNTEKNFKTNISTSLKQSCTSKAEAKNTIKKLDVEIDSCCTQDGNTPEGLSIAQSCNVSAQCLQAIAMKTDQTTKSTTDQENTQSGLGDQVGNMAKGVGAGVGMAAGGAMLMVAAPFIVCCIVCAMVVFVMKMASGGKKKTPHMSRGATGAPSSDTIGSAAQSPSPL